MALAGLRSVVSRTVDTLTATPEIAPPFSGARMPGAAAGLPGAARMPGAAASLPAAAGLPGAAAAGASGPGRVHPCPTCSRPLGRGTRRCDCCGTRLVLDVPATRASVLAGAGLALGLIAGGLGATVFLPRDPAPAASAAVTGSGATGAGVIGVTVTASAGAALRGTTALNGRLASEAASLADAVAAKSFPTADVVRILRRMSADVSAGARMVPALDGWPAAAPHQVALTAFYADLASEIGQGLAASVNSAGQYKKAARRVLATLARMPALDADARTLADTAGMEMPVVVIPDTLLVP